MKYLLNFTTIMLLGLTIVFTSCDKKGNQKSVKSVKSVKLGIITGTKIIKATAYDEWVYFSFAKRTEVKVDDFSTSLSWDIGFHRNDVRINCGKSGAGKGGAYNAGKVDFASVKEAPEKGYSVNDNIGILEKFVMPPVYKQAPGDTLLAKWVDISFGPNGMKYDYSDNIYVIKTADGKYAKIWLRNYFSDEAKSGYITMKYTYQPDGSRKFE